MKKSFLFLLISIMTVFLIAGCAEDTTKGEETTPPTVVPIDPTTNPEALQNLIGYYEIVFFYTDGSGQLSIASDCSKVEYYTGKADAKCVQGTNNVEFKGYGKVEVDNPASPTTINITTKMQMTNESLKSGTGLWSMAQNNQYNYNVFTPIPMNAIVDGAVNNGTSAVTGVLGRNLKENVDIKESTYKFELLSDGSIRNTMVDKSVVLPALGINGANVTVVMKKITALPNDYTMDKDVQFPQPVIEGFVNSPAAATAE